MPHDIIDGRIGHNGGAGNLHSHPKPEDRAADVRILCDQFIDGFRNAKDKAAFLRIAGIPNDLPCKHGGPSLKLVDVALRTEWQVATASPSFGSRELSYLPFPGELITERANLSFVYVSSARKEEVDLRDVLSARQSPEA